jgi:hypothetical protein
MTYTISRDVSEDLGDLHHYYRGSREASMAAASLANAARAEYEQKLFKIMDDLQIDRKLAPYVNIQWHTGVVTVDTPEGVIHA